MKKLIELDRKECVRTRESSDREGERTACLNPLYVRGVCFFSKGMKGEMKEEMKEEKYYLCYLVPRSATSLSCCCPCCHACGVGGLGGQQKGAKLNER